VYANRVSLEIGPPSRDRRVRRSRQALQVALVDLILEIGYDKVTVDDITQRADLARATFYAHYRDKGELLTAMIEELARDLMSRIQPLVPIGSDVMQGVVIGELFRHAQEHRNLYRAALSGAGNGSARRAYFETLVITAVSVFAEWRASTDAPARLPVDFLARAWAGAHLVLVEWWLTDRPNYTAIEMTHLEVEFMLRGIAWGIGLSPNKMSLDKDFLSSSEVPGAPPTAS